jgi:hypothetical protein
MFSKLVEGHDPQCNYEINGHQYIDGTYPTWVIFGKVISAQTGLKNCQFPEHQAMERMSSKNVCFNLNLLLFGILLFVGFITKCGGDATLCEHAQHDNRE